MTGDENLKTDEIEQLRLFYITRIKDKRLSDVLTTVEKAIKEHKEDLIVENSKSGKEIIE